MKAPKIPGRADFSSRRERDREKRTFPWLRTEAPSIATVSVSHWPGEVTNMILKFSDKKDFVMAT